MIKHLTIILSLVSLTLMAQAQVKSVTTYLGSAVKRADHLYENQYYREATELYLQALAKDSENGRIKLQLAESFRKLNNPVQAATWYGRVIHNKALIEDRHKLFYADALLSSGQLPQAEEWYLRYQQSHGADERVARKLRGIDRVATFYRDSAMYHVQLASGINSPASDFAPAFYQNGLVFASARATQRAIKHVYQWDKAPYLAVFFAENREDKFSLPALLSEIGTGYHGGPAVFYNKDTQLIFTRNQAHSHRSHQRVSTLGLFAAQQNKNGKSWSSPTPLLLNNAEYSVGHPAVTKDGQTLYFISDMPGGFGGTDLYVSYLQDGEWQSPTNLGPSINTEGDEMFPFLHQDQMLYFASNGHAGLGGLDVYKTAIGTKLVENVGYPINSASDDFGLILNEEGTQGYYSSNRGDMADDNIYQVTVDVRYLDIVVRDERTKQPIATAEVSLIGDGSIKSTASSDADGTVRFQVNPRNSYIVNVDKASYEGNVLIVGPEEIVAAEETQPIPVALTQEEGNIELTLAVINGYTNQPLVHTVVTVVQTESSDTIRRVTDEQGIIRMKVENQSHYVVSGEVDGVAWSHPAIETEQLAIDKENVLPIGVGTKLQTIPLRVMAYDSETDAPLAWVTVRLIEGGEQRAELRTQANGKVSFMVEPTRSYLVSLEATTHYDDAVIVMSEELTQDIVFHMHVPLRSAAGMTTVVANLYDSATGTPLANTIVRLRKEGTRDEVSSVSDGEGNIRFKVEEESSYRIVGDPTGHSWKYRAPTEVTGEALRPVQWSIPSQHILPDLTLSGKGVKQIPQKTEQQNTPQQKGRRTLVSVASSVPAKEAPAIPKKHSIFIRVVDEATRQPVPEAEIILIGDGAIEAVLSTDAKGLAQFDRYTTLDYIIDVSKKAYQGNAIILDTETLAGSTVEKETLVALRRATGTIDLTARLYNKFTDQAIAHTLVRLINTTSRDTLNQVTDEQGNVQFEVAGNASYLISGIINGEEWSYPEIEARALSDKRKNQLSIPVAIQEKTTPLRIVLLDDNTQKPINQVVVRLIEDGTQRALLRTKQYGEALFDVDSHSSYLVSIEPLSHYDEVIIVTSEELVPGVEYRIELPLAQAQGTISVEAQLYDSLIKSPLANTVIGIRDEETGKETTVLSDEHGNVRLKVKQGGSYRVWGFMKDQDRSYDTRLTIADDKVPSVDLKIPVFQPLSYQGLLAEAQRGQQSVPSTRSEDRISQEEIERATFIAVGSSVSKESPQLWVEEEDRIYPLLPNTPAWQAYHQRINALEVESSTGKNTTITINNVYFAFNRYSLNEQATRELDKLVTLLKRQPTLSLEVGTHTDSRGSGAYNRILSQKRAQAILMYLVKNGVTANQVYLSFYGEEQPLQPCDQSNCPESTHQLNRSGEFKLKKYNY